MSNMDNFTDDQKREIAQGEQFGLDVSVYAKPEYDWFQMEEIRKGLEQGLDIQVYADPKISFEVMRQMRKGLGFVV